MFTVTINLKDVGKYENFEDAWKKMFQEIFSLDGILLMALEQTCFMTCTGTFGPLGFYDARDLAYRCGLMDPSTNMLVENPTSLTDARREEIARTFGIANDEHNKYCEKILERVIRMENEDEDGCCDEDLENYEYEMHRLEELI